MNSSEGDISDSSHSHKAHPLLFVAIFLSFFVSFFGARDAQTSSPFLLASLTQSPLMNGQISTRDAPFAESPELVLIAKGSLRANTPPLTVTPNVLGAIVGQVDTDIKAEVTKYMVEKGDTVASLAEKFDISQNTILWANDLSSSSSLSVGQELLILPVTGTLHLVRPNDTLSEIASWYKADSRDIVSFNSLSSAAEIFAGDLLVIPNGTQPSVLPKGRLTPLPNSYFIYPIPSPARLTQGLHPFNAVDLSNGSCAESVYAAAGGTVQRTGYTSLGGNYVRILHPNGVVTYYGHLSAILTTPGTKVFQGQLVGYTGRTGYATGCHLHFEVRGAANPFAR